MFFAKKQGCAGNCKNCSSSHSSQCAGMKGSAYRSPSFPSSPQYTPYQRTPYQNYLQSATVQDVYQNRVNASMRNYPVIPTTYSRGTKDRLQQQTATRFLAGTTPLASERRKGGTFTPLFH